MDSDNPTNSPSNGPLILNDSKLGIIEAAIYHNSREDDNVSFTSSISSLHENDWHLNSFESSQLAVIDNVPSSDSCDETKSVTKSQSFSTNDHEIADGNDLPRISNFIAEKVEMTESINWLGRHVPRCVIRDLYREVLRIRNREVLVEEEWSKRPQSLKDKTPSTDDLLDESEISMPIAKTYSSALLFIDMSGFSSLSLKLDLESLSKVRTNNVSFFITTNSSPTKQYYGHFEMDI